MALHQAYVRGLRQRGGCLRVAAPVTGLAPDYGRCTLAGLACARSSLTGRRWSVPGAQHPGLHFFAGQGGSGIEPAPALAALGAAIIVGGALPSDIALNPAALAPIRLAPDGFRATASSD